MSVACFVASATTVAVTGRSVASLGNHVGGRLVRIDQSRGRFDRGGVAREVGIGELLQRREIHHDALRFGEHRDELRRAERKSAVPVGCCCSSHAACSTSAALQPSSAAPSRPPRMRRTPRVRRDRRSRRAPWSGAARCRSTAGASASSSSRAPARGTAVTHGTGGSPLRRGSRPGRSRAPRTRRDRSHRGNSSGWCERRRARRHRTAVRGAPGPACRDPRPAARGSGHRAPRARRDRRGASRSRR